MATLITDDCINCGACEPECPNNAIYQGGCTWEKDGVRQQALRDDYYFIVPDLCTECVGFFDEEQCAAVCPIECCLPDPDLAESEDMLISRARSLHPHRTIAEPFPSRFRR
ncbi:MAG: YfhL family 4Fe-4S dicluster ferredoxin [Deltaproteobacteria bacterium]|nr:YfhL family 4Fe-4S dicluster ferredoxin [Deltaproteobacteria bacterium]